MKIGKTDTGTLNFSTKTMVHSLAFIIYVNFHFIYIKHPIYIHMFFFFEKEVIILGIVFGRFGIIIGEFFIDPVESHTVTSRIGNLDLPTFFCYFI